MEYRKPKLVPRKLDPAKQQAFIDGYDNLLNNLADDEAVVFADARIRRTKYGRPAVGHLRIQGSRLKGPAGGNA